MPYRLTAILIIGFSMGTHATPLSAHESDAAALAKAAQNPIADMISLPLQNNTNFEFGPEEKTQDVLTFSLSSQSPSNARTMQRVGNCDCSCSSYSQSDDTP
jgi:hypothetical protein